MRPQRRTLRNYCVGRLSAVGPAPCGIDDLMKIRIAGRPLKLCAKPCGISHERGRIAVAPGPELVGHFASGYFLNSLDDFDDRVPLTGSDVLFRRPGSGSQGFDRGNMSVREIRDMDVVTDAGTVSRGVVVAEK